MLSGLYTGLYYAFLVLLIRRDITYIRIKFDSSMPLLRYR